MLDLDHPRTPHVFAASHQLDFILDFCKKMTLSGATGRRFTLEMIRPAFAALRWLAKERFADVSHLAAGIDQLELSAERLAELPLLNPQHRGGPAPLCPACGRAPNAPIKYDPIGYCSPCLNHIMPALSRVRSWEEGFGTEAI